MFDESNEAFRRGQELANHGAWPEALAAYERAVAVDAGNWQARFGCGLARQGLANDQAAIVDFLAVLRAQPEMPDAWYSLALSRKRLNDFAGSLADCDRALRLRPVFADAQYLRCVCLKNLGQNKLGLEAANALLAQDAGDIDARYVRATLAFEEQEFAMAMADLDIYLPAASRHLQYEALLLRGLAAHYTRQHAEALVFLTKAIEVDPANASAYCRRALVFKALGRDTDAAGDFVKCKTLIEPAG